MHEVAYTHKRADSMKTVTECGNCGAKLKVPANRDLSRLRCPRCRARLTEHAGTISAASPTPKEPAEQATRDVDPDQTLSYRDDTVTGNSSLSMAVELGRFQLRRLLGQGGFGRVYQAYDPVLDREVALKVPHLAASKKAHIERFLREAKAAARLRHPHIVAVFESGRIGEQYYIAAEFVAGQTLAAVLTKDPPDYHQAARWACDLALALDYAHNEGIVHRDIKPHNVMVNQRHQPQIMDFGLAKRVDEDATLTVDGSVIGTPAYMPPEQARGDVAAVGAASDQYSLGVVSYEMLCRQRPFSGTPQGVLHDVLHTEPPTPRSVREDLPRDLETICLKAIAKDPAARYPNCGALAEDLRRWLADESITARRVSVAERAARWARHNRSIASLIMLVVFAVVAGLVGTSAMWGRAEILRARAEDAERDADATGRALADQRDMLQETNERLEAQAEELKTARDTARRNADELAATLEEKDVINTQLRQTIAELTTTKGELGEQTAVAQGLKERQRWDEYRQTLAAAEEARRDGDSVLMVHALDRCDEDLRGWEWHFLRRLVTPASFELGHSDDDRSTEIHNVAVGAERIATAHDDARVRIWDIVSGKVTRELSGFRDVAAIGFHKHVLLTLASYGQLTTTNAQNGNRVFQKRVPDELARMLRSQGRVEFSGDGARLAAWSDRDVQVWTTTNVPIQPVAALQPGFEGSVEAVQFVDQGKRLWLRSRLAEGGDLQGFQVKLWNLNSSRSRSFSTRFATSRARLTLPHRQRLVRMGTV